ncbi:starch-binding protein [Bacteroidia bacterium]|nr:starch-binding protein [Bacteroidia bacterium]
MKTKIKIVFAGIIGALFFPACDNNLLDQEPKSQISPEKYLVEATQLEAYANGLYPSILPGGNDLILDAHTDNQAAQLPNNKYVSGQWKVTQTDGSNWNFGNIYNCNYFLDVVLTRFEAGAISGSADNVKHYIGEVYFLRAYEYFKKYKMFGDFPIVTKPLPDEKETLTEASKRSPRNEVARFILSDLDKAIDLMATTPDTRKTRISKESALLLKSRVALYEGTFLKYFKGTAFVPGGQGWPGATKDYNKSYAFPSGGIDAEINFFLDEAISASKQVADAVTLTNNTGLIQQDITEPGNPYMDMYASINLSSYGEVLLWREYNIGLGVGRTVAEYTQAGNNVTGTTRGFVESFLMANGLPIYASASGYHGDDSITAVRTDRDNRLFLFLKEPKQKNVLINGPAMSKNLVEPYPDILRSDPAMLYNTGYALRKGNPLDAAHISLGTSNDGYTGLIIFRGVEALLNYMEAYYERHGSLDGTATQYWQDIRSRAKVDANFNATISATDVAKEAPNDWGAYSAGQLIDATLYNIRRERRCEFIGEGMRWADLQRWRSCDQMITSPYHIEGFKLWGPMKDWYNNADGSSKLTYGLDLAGALVSPPDISDYLRPYEKARGSLALDGYIWKMAHYLNPIALQDVLITSQNNDISTSPIYQNPGWTLTVGESAIE